LSEQQNVQAIKDAYAAFERGDVGAILAMLTDDVSWDMPGPTEIPYAGSRRGHSGAGEFFRRLAESEDVQLFEPRQFLANGNLVVVLGRYEARVKSTGKTAKSDWVHLFEFRDGKVSCWREFYDSAEYAEAYR
jgi:ketosteroid isomerase-like protein